MIEGYFLASRDLPSTNFVMSVDVVIALFIIVVGWPIFFVWYLHELSRVENSITPKTGCETLRQLSKIR
jgi:hypothetical protein